MLDWLQHLFTARALEREVAQLTLKISDLEAQITEKDRVIAIKNEEIRSLNHHIRELEAEREGRGQIVSEWNPFDNV